MSDTSASGIAASYATMSAQSTQNALAIAMMKQQAQASNALVDLLASAAGAGQQQAALPPGVGQNLDIRA